MYAQQVVSSFAANGGRVSTKIVSFGSGLSGGWALNCVFQLASSNDFASSIATLASLFNKVL